eukprot:6290864-Pyramimonas_sp.AAC.1
MRLVSPRAAAALEAATVPAYRRVIESGRAGRAGRRGGGRAGEEVKEETEEEEEACEAASTAISISTKVEPYSSIAIPGFE